MTEIYQIVSMSRPFRTLNSMVISDPTLRNLSVSCMGFLRDVAASRHSSNKFGSALDFATLLRFSLFEAVKNQSDIA